MKQILVLLGLTASCMAAPLKQKLSQMTGGGDGGSGGELDCVCELPGDAGSGFPDLGSGEFHSFGNSATVFQAAAVVTVPDTEWTSECETACCACNVGQHSSSAAAYRNRHFDITGGITVAETVEFVEAGNASEESAGHSQKATACIVSNEDGSGSPPDGEICVCLNNTEDGNGSAGPN